MQNNKAYPHYIQVPVTEAERDALKETAASLKKTPGRLLHYLVFEATPDQARVRNMRQAMEHLAAIHAEIMRTLQNTPTGYEMYESDLIALDDRVSELAEQIAAIMERG